MASASEILLRIRGQDQTGSAFKSVNDKLGRMKNIASTAMGMTVGMIGYDLVNSLTEAGRSAINSSQQLDYFAARLQMNQQETNKFKKEIDGLQEEFRKVDMTAVGATAEEIAVKMDLPKSKVSDLTRMTAVLSSTFVKEGRTQEDAVLAVGDALDGQFRRLQEIGIQEGTLKENGWSGDLKDQAGLIDALNKTMQNMGYEQTAKDITNLDEAFNALTVAGGRLIADVIIPLTPPILAVINALINADDTVKMFGAGVVVLGLGLGVLAGPITSVISLFGMIGGVLPTITGLFGVAATETAALTTEQIALAAAQTSLTAEEIGAAAAHVANGSALAGEGVAATGASTGFWSLAAAELAAVWPILAIIAAIGAIVIAFEQLGEYLGWWTDFGTMLDSIKDGVMRLWDAFVNSQAVQRTITIVTLAFNALKAAAQPVIDWLGAAWNDLFNGGGAGSGGPDAIGAIIDAFTVLDNIGTQVFNTMITWGTAVYGALLPIITIVSNIFNVLSQLWNGQVSLGQGFMMLLQNFTALHGQIFTLIVNIWRNILSAIGNALVKIVPMVVRFLLNALVQLILFRARMYAAAIAIGRSILNGIINFVRSIPSRVVSFIRQLPGRIRSVGGSVLSAARSLGKQAYDGVVNYVTQIPDKVGQEFHGIAGKVIAVGGELYNAAKDAAQKLWDGFNSILDQHSPGIFMRAIDYEFRGIPGMITNSLSSAYGAAKDYATQMVTGFNNPTGDVSLQQITTLRDSTKYTPQSNNGGNTYIVRFEKGAFDVDARNFTEQEAQGILITAFESINPENPEGNGGAGAI